MILNEPTDTAVLRDGSQSILSSDTIEQLFFLVKNKRIELNSLKETDAHAVLMEGFNKFATMSDYLDGSQISELMRMAGDKEYANVSDDLNNLKEALKAENIPKGTKDEYMEIISTLKHIASGFTSNEYSKR